jgi:predicted DNA-binding transcriptional regulator YafY
MRVFDSQRSKRGVSVVIELDNAARSQSQSLRYRIEPEALVVYEGSIYIAGYRADLADDSESQAVRFFKIDRVSRAKPTSRPFTRRQATISSLLSDSMTLFRSASPPRKYRIKITPDRAKWAMEKPFHPGQKVRVLDDGSLLLDIDRAWDDEMVPQLLTLGDRAEVLKPLDIRSRLAKEAAAIVKQYASREVRKPGRR